MAQAKNAKKIRMNTGTCRSVQRKIEGAGNQMDNQVRKVRQIADQMVGQQFISPSADQFHVVIDNWCRETERMLNDLDNLANRLGREIVKFQEADRKFGK